MTVVLTTSLHCIMSSITQSSFAFELAKAIICAVSASPRALLACRGGAWVWLRTVSFTLCKF